MSPLISKSVRLPSDLVSYIESQPGSTFTDKFIVMMNEVRSGEASRQQKISDLEKIIKDRQRSLNHYDQLMRDCGRVAYHMEHIVNAAIEFDKKYSVSDLPFT